MAEPNFAMDPFRQAWSHKSGRYYAPMTTETGTGFTALDELRAVPFLVSRPTNYDRIGVEVTTAGSAGAVVRLGVYNSLADTAFPNSLVLDAGTIDATAIAFVENVINLALSQGLYWLAAVSQVATCATRTIGTVQPNPVGMSSGTSVNARSLVVAGVSGALPTKWGENISESTVGPRVLLRAK